MELRGKYTLDDLHLFCEKAIIRLGGSFIPSGDLVSIVTPQILLSYPNVSARYENMTFTRKTATRKKGVELLGIGHPLINALIEYYRSDNVSGDILNVDYEKYSGNLSARYIFRIEFSDNTYREIYKGFPLIGAEITEDIVFLRENGWKKTADIHQHDPVKERCEMLARNYEAYLRSENEGVINIRSKCVGIINMH